MLNYEKGAPPLYAQIEKILKEKIEQGEYKKGDIIPGEKEIMEQYGVSRVTARQAMAALSQRGYVKSQRGIGTEVTYDKINEHIKGVTSFTEEMKRHNITMETSFCKMEKMMASKQIAQELEMEINDFCYCLTRVRCVEGSPLVYTKTYLKAKADFSLEESCYKESLYTYLKEVHNMSIVRGKDVLEAVLPDKEVRRRLEIEDDTPVFKRTRKTYIEQFGKEELFEYSVCFYPGNRYQYTVDL